MRAYTLAFMSADFINRRTHVKSGQQDTCSATLIFFRAAFDECTHAIRKLSKPTNGGIRAQTQTQTQTTSPCHANHSRPTCQPVDIEKLPGRRVELPLLAQHCSVAKG